MKYILSGLILVMTLISGTAVAQSSPDQIVKTKQTTVKKPLLILRTNGVDYKLAESSFKEINPDWIDEVQVIKEEEKIKSLGNEAKDGIVILTLKENLEAAALYSQNVRSNNEKVTITVPKSIRIKD